MLNHDLEIKQVGQPAANFVWVELEGMRIYSCYFSQNIKPDEFLSQFGDLDNLRSAHGEILVSGDFNSKSPEWGFRRLDKGGKALSEMISRLDLITLNERYSLTFRRGQTGSVVDITLAMERTATCTMHQSVVS